MFTESITTDSSIRQKRALSYITKKGREREVKWRRHILLLTRTALFLFVTTTLILLWVVFR